MSQYLFRSMPSQSELEAKDLEKAKAHAWRRAVRIDREAERLLTKISESDSYTEAEYLAAVEASNKAQAAHDEWARLAGVQSAGLYV
jgi:hypothetical protein